MLGRGRGLGSVLRALRTSEAELTVIVAVAEYAGPGPSQTTGTHRRRWRSCAIRWKR